MPFRLHGTLGTAALFLHKSQQHKSKLVRNVAGVSWTAPLLYNLLAPPLRHAAFAKSSFHEAYCPHMSPASTQFSVTQIFKFATPSTYHRKDNMDALNQHGTDQCFRFNDGTRPVCVAEGQLGHQPCLHQKQTAQALLGSESPRTRRMLLRRENRNLRMVRRFTDMEHRVVISETTAWRKAVAAKEAKLNMMHEHRRQRKEEQQE